MAPRDLSNVDWERVFAEAVDIALAYTKRDVEDLVEDAMELLFAGEAAWDDSSKHTLPEHLVLVGLKARRNRMRTERRRRNPKVIGKMVQLFEEDRPPTPEDEAADAEERQRKKVLLEELLEDLADDSEARGIVLLELEGVHGALEQVARGAGDIETVRRARKRVARHVRALVERAESDDEAAS
jgi:DNA-directed RNA polymerase specialized sigma24 family protein